MALGRDHAKWPFFDSKPAARPLDRRRREPELARGLGQGEVEEALHDLVGDEDGVLDLAVELATLATAPGEYELQASLGRAVPVAAAGECLLEGVRRRLAVEGAGGLGGGVGGEVGRSLGHRAGLSGAPRLVQRLALPERPLRHGGHARHGVELPGLYGENLLLRGEELEEEGLLLESRSGRHIVGDLPDCRQRTGLARGQAADLLHEQRLEDVALGGGHGAERLLVLRGVGEGRRRLRSCCHKRWLHRKAHRRLGVGMVPSRVDGGGVGGGDEGGGEAGGAGGLPRLGRACERHFYERV
mmetsp:Transcript_2373/g.5987  ORF Transcript_2373/g.5987 Transcript_2373/m.5987 type:complete len:300 (-) Transcript_2373:42-941(-)